MAADILPAAAPPVRLFLGEGLALPGLIAAPLLPPAPMVPGRGEPVMVLPGFLAHDLMTIRLRRSLRAAGYLVAGWHLGINLGARADLLDRIAERIAGLARQAGAPVTLIGWSLGGVYAREVAKLVPGQVRLVMTLGSPFSGDPRANNAWRLYELVNDHPVDDPPVTVNLPEKPPVPTVALWSPRDGIVPPAAAAGLPGERDAACQLACRHMAYAWSAPALAAIGAILADWLKRSA